MKRLTRHDDKCPDSWPLYELIACDVCKETTTQEERDEYGCPNCDSKGDALSYLGLYEDSGLSYKRAQELGKADREGRLVVLKGAHVLSDGEEALRKAMYTVGVTNNPVNRYIADAIAEKLGRDEAAMKADTKEGM